MVDQHVRAVMAVRMILATILDVLGHHGAAMLLRAWLSHQVTLPRTAYLGSRQLSLAMIAASRSTPVQMSSKRR